MANRDVVTRTGAGVALTTANHDQNMNSFAGTVDQQSGTTYTVVYTDQNKTIELNNATMTCTMDAIATIAAAIDTDKWKVTLKNINAAAATIARSSTDTFDGATSLTLQQYEAVTLQIDGAGTGWNIIGWKVTAFGAIDINGGTLGGFTIDGNWTAAGQTCADLGTVSDADFTQFTLGGSAAMTAIETTLAGSATKLVRADAISAAIATALPKAAVIQHKETANTAGQTYTSAAGWEKVGLNETVSDPSSIVTSLTSSVIVLAAGTYLVHAEIDVQSNNTGNARLRLYDTTGTSVVGQGVQASKGSTTTSLRMTLDAVVVSTGQNLELQLNVGGSDTFTQPALNNGSEEVYAQITFTKVAAS